LKELAYSRNKGAGCSQRKGLGWGGSLFKGRRRKLVWKI